MMRKRLDNGLPKNLKRVVLFVPKDIRLSFYMSIMGDVSTKTHFTNHDLDNIKLLDQDINMGLFDINENIEEGDIYALLEEGILQGRKTGADLGIYDYEPIVKQTKKLVSYTKFVGDKFVHSMDEIDNQDLDTQYTDNDDCDFANCILAEEGALDSELTQVVSMFKGYLEVKRGEFSFIRKCDVGRGASLVYIPEYYVKKYQLRQGDEIMCTYTQQDGKMLLNTLFTINQQSVIKWNVDRPWFNYLKSSVNKPLKGSGDYTKIIINKFNLFEGDSVFLYLNKTSVKSKTLPPFMDELGKMFDKVVYINPNYKSTTNLGKCNNVVKFCTSFNDNPNLQATIALLGANYAKRMIELGKKVAVVVDDIDTIIALDNELKIDTCTPICKTILDSAKVGDSGSATSFGLVSLRAYDLSSYNKYDIIKRVETLGIVIDNNEIDLYNSYRI